MVGQIQNDMATVLLVRPRLTGKVTVLSTPTRLLDIVQLKSRISGLRTSAVSSQDYLVSSLCLSPDSEEALNIIRKRKPYSIKSTENADSVISLFKDYGFDHTHIAKIFSSFPELLTFNPDRVLKPKLDYLFRSGIPIASLFGIITTNPYILRRSLQKVIIPCVDLLRSLSNDDDRALASFLLHKRAHMIFCYFSETATPANVDTLRRHGVPDPHILRLALVPGTLGLDAEHFSSVAREIKNMGFEAQSINFTYGLRGLAGMSKEKWVSKMELVKKCFGWSHDQQVVALFMKNPNVFTLSEEKLRRGFEILTNRMGWTPDDISKYLVLLGYSFERRILPRFYVLEILLSKGLISKITMGNAFIFPEDKFLDRYVERYQKELPQLMEIYINSKGLKIQD